MYYETAIQDTYAIRAVALESSYISNAVQAVRDFFPSMFDAINKGFDQVKTIKPFVASSEDTNTYQLSRKESVIVKMLKEKPYSDLIKLRLACPEGFKGNYVNYVSDVLATFDYHDNVTLPALEDFYVLIASVITNRNAKLSLKDETAAFRALKFSREEVNKKLADQFIARSTQSELEYGKLFSSNEEVTELFQIRHRLVARLVDVKLSTVTEYVKKLNNALETLIKIATDKSMSNLSPVQLKNLTEGAYEIAAQVEFFAINYYRAETIATTILHLQDKLTRRLKM